MALQSLLIYGMQIGIKGSTEQQQKLVRHLYRRSDVVPTAKQSTKNNPNQNDIYNGDNEVIEWVTQWTTEDIRRLKYYRNTSLGKSLLATLKKRQSAMGAYELLVELNVWDKNEEEIGLLRSGFPVDFLEEEIRCSKEVSGRIR